MLRLVRLTADLVKFATPTALANVHLIATVCVVLEKFATKRPALVSANLTAVETVLLARCVTNLPVPANVRPIVVVHAPEPRSIAIHQLVTANVRPIVEAIAQETQSAMNRPAIALAIQIVTTTVPGLRRVTHRRIVAVSVQQTAVAIVEKEQFATRLRVNAPANPTANKIVRTTKFATRRIRAIAFVR